MSPLTLLRNNQWTDPERLAVLFSEMTWMAEPIAAVAFICKMDSRKRRRLPRREEGKRRLEPSTAAGETVERRKDEDNA